MIKLDIVTITTSSLVFDHRTTVVQYSTSVDCKTLLTSRNLYYKAISLNIEVDIVRYHFCHAVDITQQSNCETVVTRKVVVVGLQPICVNHESWMAEGACSLLLCRSEIEPYMV